MFDLVRWLLFVPLAGLFVVGAVANAWIVSMMWRRSAANEHAPSMVPFAPGLAGVLACLVAPWPPLVRWAWLPLLLDVGSGPYILLLLWAAWRDKRR
ncbi:MAG: hypothetical protein HY535_09265 [Chloroflexi bacterium]|nr:hypothetical protein [Chloroflexota bacterium]